MKIFYVLAILLSSAITAHAQDSCRMEKWIKYGGVTLFKEKRTGYYMFVVQEVKVDADGAPNAYHPDDVGLNCVSGTGFKGLDCPANGGYPSQSWWRSAIVPDPHRNDVAYVQPDGEFKGFFVSQTSLKDASKPAIDPSKYVDSSSVPYLVFPGNFYKLAGTGAVGDLGFAINLDNGNQSPFIVAEVGPPKARLGEMSIALGSALGGNNPNPRTGAGVPRGNMAFIVFPRSKASPPWPMPSDKFATDPLTHLNEVGGSEMLRSCAVKALERR